MVCCLSKVLQLPQKVLKGGFRPGLRWICLVTRVLGSFVVFELFLMAFAFQLAAKKSRNWLGDRWGTSKPPRPQALVDRVKCVMKLGWASCASWILNVVAFTSWWYGYGSKPNGYLFSRDYHLYKRLFKGHRGYGVLTHSHMCTGVSFLFCFRKSFG